MKRAIYWLLMLVSGLCVLPTLVGLVDAWTWLMLGHSVSGIEWQIENGRIVIAWLLLVIGVFVPLLALHLAEES